MRVYFPATLRFARPYINVTACHPDAVRRSTIAPGRAARMTAVHDAYSFVVPVRCVSLYFVVNMPTILVESSRRVKPNLLQWCTVRHRIERAGRGADPFPYDKNPAAAGSAVSYPPVTGLPLTVDLKATRGDTWGQTFRLRYGDTPVDLSSATLASWAQRSLDAAGRIVATPEPAVVLVALILTPPTDGLIAIQAPLTPMLAGTYRYDVEVTEAGAVTTWISGSLKILDDVTNHG